MTIDPALIQALVEHLLSRHRDLQSWRQVAKGYPGVAPGTLCRIAKEGGRYLPKDRKELRVLGLVERKKRTEMDKAISKMVRETKKAVMRSK